MDDQFADGSSWHSIRPGYPSLSLSVREITSVSVTFVLSSPYSAHDADISLASLGLSSSDDDEASTSRETASVADTDQPQIVSGIIRNGFSVKVNGTPWRKVIVSKDEVDDEAIIIVHGLMPARQYDVELGVMPGETSLRGQVTTDPEALSSDPARLSSCAPDEQTFLSSPESSNAPLSPSPPHPHSHSYQHSNGAAHSPPSASAFTLEDRRVQLTHALSQLTSEHAQLSSELKSARRESQKADAALRAEIDTLRRASDRQAAGEGRARKKVLALQEAVKQTLAAAQDIEALVSEIEGALPGLEERKREVEREWEQVSGEADRARRRREEAEGRERAREEAAQQELAGLVTRLEKLSGKRQKLEGEGGVIQELEERLRKLEEERERVERDPYGYEGDPVADEEPEGVPAASGSARTADDSSPEGDREKPLHAPSHAHPNPPHNFHPGQHHAHPRKRHSHPHMPHHPHQHHHPRPSFPPPRPTAYQHQDPVHRPQGQRASFPGPNHPTPGVLHLPPHGHPHKNHHGRSFRAQHAQGSSSSSASSTPVGSTTTGSSSMLSSRAPPFEPTRHRSGSQSHQAQAAVAAKSELNPGSTPFAPRSPAAQAVVSAVGTGAPGRPAAAS
ncbi:hypothetical protein BD309DRAFT_952790 [Dichomitus squalens]|nr:hypothetical protein BD309DRAFT_952790 [Dichomitus squalens]